MRLFFYIHFSLFIVFSAKAQNIGQSQHLEGLLSEWRDAMPKGLVSPETVIDSCYVLLKVKMHDSMQSNILSLQASAFRQLEKLDNALILHQKVIILRENCFGKKSNPVATTLMNMGNCYAEMNRIEEAELIYRKALKIKEQCFPNQAHAEKLGIYNALGHFLRMIGKKKEAFFYLQKSLFDSEKIYSPTSAKTIPTRRVLADFYFEENRIAEAIDQLNKAAAIERAISGNQKSLVLADILNNLANCYLKTRAYETALQISTEATDIYRTLPSVPTQQYAKAVFNLATSFLELGDVDAATKSLNIAANFFQTPSVDLADVQLNFGRIEWLKGNANKALDYFSEAVTLYEQMPYQPLISEGRLASAYLNIGDLYLFDKKNTVSAEMYFAKALKIYEALNQKGNIAQCLLKIGQSRKETGKKGEAKQLYLQGSELAMVSKDSIVIFNAFFLMGELATNNHDWNEALTYYNKAQNALQTMDMASLKTTTSDYERLQIIEATSFVLKSKARETQNRSDWQVALQESKRTIDALANLKLKLRERTSEVVLQHLFFRVFDSAIESCIALNDKPQAFFFAEKSKLSLLKRLFFNVTNDKFTTDFDFPIDALQKSLRTNQSLIQYHFAADRLFVFILKRDTFNVKTLEVSSDLSQIISQFYESCSISPALLPDVVKDSAATTFVRLSQKLYKALVQPFESDLTIELTIIPDGLLCYIPFEALVRGNEQLLNTAYQFKNHDYLLQHHIISYDYSSTFWLSLKQLPKPEAHKKVLTIAPVFALLSSRNDLSPLEHNIEEAVSISKKMGGDEIVAEQATKQRLLKDINQYSILHFSTHGILDEAAAEHSYLAFSETATDTSIEESQLRAAEIFNLKLNAEMVVLSACRTAVGRLYRGEGIMSLARSFRYAGARTLVASLWNVDDTQTPSLMTFFYEQLKKGMSKSAALTMAKREYLKTVSHDKAHPFYWAGFLLIGDESALTTHPLGWIAWALVVICLLFFVFRWYKRKY